MTGVSANSVSTFLVSAIVLIIIGAMSDWNALIDLAITPSSSSLANPGGSSASSTAKTNTTKKTSTTKAG